MQCSDESHFSLTIAFSAVLKTLRVNRGLTQQHLAETSSRTYLSKSERGQSSLTLDNVELAEYDFGAKPADASRCDTRDSKSLLKPTACGDQAPRLVMPTIMRTPSDDKTIVVVDDELSIRDVLCELLHMEGLNAVGMENADDARLLLHS